VLWRRSGARGYGVSGVSTLQARIPVLARRGQLPEGLNLPMLAAILLAATAGAWVAVRMPHFYRAGLALVIGLNLIVLGMKWPRAAALATLLFLPFLGLIRRLLIEGAGWSANDPLVVVAPVVALFLVYRIYMLEGRRFDRDLLSKLVLFLLAVAVFQVVNPLAGGGVLVNLGGLIFLSVPLLWFFIGRGVGDERSVRFVLSAAILVAVAVGIYGMWQTELAAGERMPAWDRAWYEEAGYGALRIANDANANNEVRPFSTFPSNGEYSGYLSLALIAIAALAFHRRFWALLALPVLLPAIFWSGGRAFIALTGVALVVLAGVRTRNLALGVVVVVLGVGSIFGLAAVAGPRLDKAAGVSGSVVTQRNISGLLHPLDPGRSSALARWGAFGTGISLGFQNPLGSGTGASNVAGRNLTDEAKGSRETDHDVSDVFLSLGVLGGVTYLVIIFLVFRGVFSRYMRESGWLLFTTAGLLIVMFGNWLNGGMYTMAAITWFLIGWATRPRPEVEQEEQPDRSGAAMSAKVAA